MAAVSAGYVMSIPTSTPYRLRVDRLEGLVADERGERKASGSLRVTLSSAQKIQQEQHPGSQTGLRWKPSSSWKRPISRRFWAARWNAFLAAANMVGRSSNDFGGA